ncbi:hypothetical protein PENSPDRAFT_288337 [Peniophora sp. CONT]|nr:hypothetical protein PENSPDRAFT_288337 [Peniophora sp. CONT]
MGLWRYLSTPQLKINTTSTLPSSNEPSPSRQTVPPVPMLKCRTIRSRELQESNPFLAPRKTEQILISSKHEPYSIPAFNTLDFTHWVCPPEHVQADPEGRGGWSSALHPDGSLYFHKACQGDCGPFNMLTEAYLHGEDMLYEVTAFARYMWRHMMLVQDKFVGGDFELAINVKIDSETDKVVWSYYFVDHIHRMPFWMRDYNPSIHMRTTEKLGASSPDHLRHLLTAMYWEHCALYPRHAGGARVLSDDIHAHMVTELAWCAAESVIAPIRYTAPYTAEEAIRLREQLDYLRMNTERNPEPYIEVAGRTMSTIERWRYNFLHGTQVIRRFRGQTVLPHRNHSLIYRVLIPLLFYAPLPHFYDCKSVYLDGILANEPEWANYVAKLLAEWQEFVLYATILLNANLAFLTVPNAILMSANGAASSAPYSATIGSDRQPVSPASILSYCSMLASFGSIMMGLLLVRQHRGEEVVDNPRTNKATFMEKRQSPRFGFELLSILYSLPYVLLMCDTCRPCRCRRLIALVHTDGMGLFIE